MKVVFIFFGGIFLLLSIPNYALDTFHEGYGFQSYGKERVISIHVDGFLLLDGTEVLDTLQVNGSVEARNAKINILQVNGEVDLMNSTISGTTKINGSLKAEKTVFKEDVSIATKIVTLKACSLTSIRIRRSGNEQQVLDVQQGTVITGPIVFEAGNGEIWLSNQSEIKGNVMGASVIQKNLNKK